MIYDYEGVPEAAVEYISKAEMLIVDGTSLAVYPAASFVRYFRGKYIVIIKKCRNRRVGKTT